MKEHMSTKIFLNTLFLLWGLCLTMNAQATTFCGFQTRFLPDSKGNATKVVVNDQGQLEVTTSDKNTLTDFSVSMLTEVEMYSAYRGGDSCFLSPMATNYTYTSGNLRITTLSESLSGCGVWIGIPDGRVDYKGHATNFNFPYGGAYVYEIWGCVGTVTLKLKVSVIDPAKSFRNGTVKGQLFDPTPILKFSSGQLSRDLNGAYSFNVYQQLFVKSPDCFVKLSSKVASAKSGPTVR